jgi:hypothetical protein
MWPRDGATLRMRGAFDRRGCLDRLQMNAAFGATGEQAIREKAGRFESGGGKFVRLGAVLRRQQQGVPILFARP